MKYEANKVLLVTLLISALVVAAILLFVYVTPPASR